MFKAPVIYFPSTIVLLEDDSLYAKLLIHRLPIKNLKHFESADFLLLQEKNDLLFVDNNTNKINTINSLKKNLNMIKKQGNLISVIISDLYMKNLLGIEIFNRLTSSFIGRILISNFIGQPNNDIINAINDGTIDIILDKTNKFIELLPKAIFAAKSKFFTAISNELFYNLSHDHPLSDTDFAKFFLSKLEEIHPDEVIPNQSLTRFIFAFSDDRIPMVFHISTMKEVNYYLTSTAAETAPKEILNHLLTGKYMLCHEEQDDVLPDGRLWPLFIRPAKQFCSQNQKFFYSISEKNI